MLRTVAKAGSRDAKGAVAFALAAHTCPKALPTNRVAHAGTPDVDPERPDANGFAVGEAHRLLSVLSSLIVATGWGKGKDSPLPKPAFGVHQRNGVHLLAHAARRGRTTADPPTEQVFTVRLPFPRPRTPSTKMGASPQPLLPLMHQAISLVEEFHANRSEQRTPKRSRWLPPDPEPAATPSWLKSNANRDLAARVAFRLALKTKTKVGYLALGECSLHALMRMWLLVAGVEASRILRGDVEEEDFRHLTAAAGRIACSGLVFSDQDVPKKKIQQSTRQFIEDSQLEFLVVDDPDVETLRNPALLPEQEHWWSTTIIPFV